MTNECPYAPILEETYASFQYHLESSNHNYLDNFRTDLLIFVRLATTDIDLNLVEL